MVNKTYVRLDPGGAYKVGDTRVSLDSVVYAYLQGGTAESVARSYPGLEMEDIYGALAFYLANRAEVDKYLEGQRALFDKLQAEAQLNPSPVLQKLRAFKAAQRAHSAGEA